MNGKYENEFCECDNSQFSADYILSKALDIGEEILRCGGEPHRIEDTVTRICNAYGVYKADIFALPSLITASVRMSDGTHSSQVRRVYKTSNNMYILDEINNLSRDVCSKKVLLSEIENSIKNIKNKAVYDKPILYLASFLAAGGFAVFFGGCITDALVAGVVGLIINLLNIHGFAFLNQMIDTVIVSFIGASCALIIVHFGLGSNPDMVMIGTIMLLIPGLAFGNAVRDLLFGDTVSGLIQLVQAVLKAVMVAFGYVGALLIFGGVNL